MSFQKTQARAIFSIVLVLVLVAIVVTSIVFPPADWVPAAKWGAALEASGVTGAIVFVVLGTAATAVGLPRQLVAFIGGLAYGVITGLLLSLLAAISGCFLTVVISRRFFAVLIANRFPAFVGMLQRLIEKDVFVKILILRLQPLGTNLLTNLCIGFTSARVSQFLIASAVGYIPQMLVFVLLGSGVRVGSSTQFQVSFVLLCVSLLLGVYLYRKHKRDFLT